VSLGGIHGALIDQWWRQVTSSHAFRFQLEEHTRIIRKHFPSRQPSWQSRPRLTIPPDPPRETSPLHATAGSTLVERDVNGNLLGPVLMNGGGVGAHRTIAGGIQVDAGDRPGHMPKGGRRKDGVRRRGWQPGENKQNLWRYTTAVADSAGSARRSPDVLPDEIRSRSKRRRRRAGSRRPFYFVHTHRRTPPAHSRW
jgi:hypothetical protein